MKLKDIAGIVLIAGVVAAVLAGSNATAAEPARYRKPAPLEDDGPQIAVPVFGRCAGHEGTDATLSVMEWVAKRSWHILGLPYERKDFTGPPAQRVAVENGWLTIRGTVAVGGLPLRNQEIACAVALGDAPLLVVLRSTDAFGELLLELDLEAGTARARSVTVSRSMIGGQSHSSPLPEQSSNRIVRTNSFIPPRTETVRLQMRTLGSAVLVRLDGTTVLSLTDPDPAGGTFGFGSAGTARVRDIQQWELVTAEEKERRTACHEAMHRFSEQIDTYYEGDVRARNDVAAMPTELRWTWPATGATARFRIDGPRVRATVRAGLYGNNTLLEGTFPEVAAVSASGEVYRSDPDGTAQISGDDTAVRFALPLLGARGGRATARVLAALTVQTVWFWTVTIEGVEADRICAFFPLAEPFALTAEGNETGAADALGVTPRPGATILRHNAKAGYYIKAIEPKCTTLGARGAHAAVTAAASRLRFATVILPAQPLNLTGFRNRMVHFIRYPEGPVEDWRRQPSRQEYPTGVDLARFAGHGAGAMVWHHTWLGNDFRDREGFFVNHEAMQSAMRETHRLGMKMIGYLGIVPGRSALLGFEDVCPLGGAATFGGYGKNWDLQDHTFYHAAGRYPEFLVWLTDYWCKEYGIDGFYLDGGAFGLYSWGPRTGPLHNEDADLSLDELQHRTYWRVKKVLKLNGSGYGLEPWSGLDWMLNGFYDCMMIGESFQEADPEYYRNGHNALLTGCTVKMYGMRESSQNLYNLAMAAVNLSDIQVCSGNGAWGDHPDTAETWQRVRPFWDLLGSIDWDALVEARPWYAPRLVRGAGFYAGYYTEPKRVLLFLANRTETPGRFAVTIDRSCLPPAAGRWLGRYCLGRTGALGELTTDTFEVELPALHDGPIGIELVAEPLPFVPSIEGKKLLLFRGPVEGADDVAFDGVLTGGPMAFFKRLDRAELLEWAERTAAKDFGRHTDNFFICYSYPGKSSAEFDWFDDLSWIVENWRIMAAAARKARFKGICFDTEYYEGLPLFGYAAARHHATRSLEEYRRQVCRQGAEIMRAVNESFPDITILTLFGYSGSYYGVPQHPVSREKIYTLVSAFVDGMLSECGPNARIFDMHEQSFSFRERGSFARARAIMQDLMPERSFGAGRYRRNHRSGFSFWADCWENAAQGRPFDVDDLENNYYTPAEMAYTIHEALAYSDGYVWMWPGVIDWYTGTAKTMDAGGKEVERALPEAYLEALRRARRPSLPPPPRSRKPNTYRNLPARTQEGWSDEETFANLWKEYEFLADLPVEWRFRTDPDEIGVERDWFRPRFDASAWPTITIREFWENQGYSPYDGAAWYRLDYTPPSMPAGRKVFLAFGAVADEAWVYVNGKRLYASRYGDNIRHRRFLVDVTETLSPSSGNVIAVRVWNTGWCGGIWKNVKLVAAR